MSESGSKRNALLLAAGALALVAGHFLMGASGDAAQRSVQSKVERKAFDHRELDAAKKEAQLAKQRPQLDDTKEQRDAKEFQRRMKLLGETPVEVVDDQGAAPPLQEISNVEDLKKILEDGGRYAGPLPPELQAWADERERKQLEKEKEGNR